MLENKTIVYIHLDGEFVPAGVLTLQEFDYNREYGPYGSGYDPTLEKLEAAFSYGRRYLERPNAMPIDPVQLPLTQEEFRSPFLFGAFEDASPDDWGRHLLIRAAEDRGIVPSKFDFLTVLDMENRIGALAFGPDLNGPATYRPSWRPREIAGESLDLATLLNAVDKVLDYQDLTARERRFLIRGSSVGGAQPKALVELEDRYWIAKFSRELEAWPTCRTELAAMRLAGQCGIRIPACKVIQVGNRDVYLVERFDRENGLRKRRLRKHFISAMTLIGARGVQDGSYGDIARAMRRHGPVRHLDEDLTELFRRMVFNMLCNNHDDHLKNHGFFYVREEKGWRLSPAYDIVPQPMMEQGAVKRLQLTVGAHGRICTVENALSSCADFGLETNRAAAIIDEMSGFVQKNWKKENLRAGVPERILAGLGEAYAALKKS